MVGPFYAVETTLNPGVFYNVSRAEMERLAELGVLIGAPVQPAEVLDSQLADLVNDVTSLLRAAVGQVPPAAHTHPSTAISDSGSTGRALLATTSTLSARTLLDVPQTAAVVASTEKAAASGVATLDAGTKVPIAQIPTGTTASTVTIGNDSRLSDQRAPTDASVTPAKFAAAAIDPVAGTAGARTLGTGAQQAAAGSHSHTGLTAASETAVGVVELATAAETTTGTDNTRAVHPAGLKVELDKKAPALITQTTQTGTSYTFVLADANTLVEGNNAAATTFTVPPNSSVAFPVGTSIVVRQYGAGQITIAPGAGVTVRSRGARLKTSAQYAEITLMKRATDEWVLTGDATV